MTFRNNGKKRNPKRLMSAFMSLVICIIFFYLLARDGFKIGNLVFGIFFAYLTTAFYRTSNEY